MIVESSGAPNGEALRLLEPAIGGSWPQAKHVIFYGLVEIVGGACARTW